MFVASGISKSMSGRVVIHPTSISLGPSSITVLIGPNGAGKSTLLRSLTMVDPPDLGVIEVDGARYEFGEHKADLRPNPWPKVTAVFQGIHLWPNMTIKDNLLLALKSPKSRNDEGADSAKEEVREIVSHTFKVTGNGTAQIDEIFHDFHLAHIMNRLPSEVSAGERQRAAILRALILKPRYLFLDEPTSSMDIKNIQMLETQLLQLKSAGNGMAAFVVTHLTGFARAIADQVLFMDNGTVLEQGLPEILAKPATDALARFIAIH